MEGLGQKIESLQKPLLVVNLQILQCLQDIRYEVNYTQRILWLIAIVVTVQFLLFAVFSGVIEVDDFGNWNFWFQEEDI